jgi:hypothetical protein
MREKLGNLPGNIFEEPFIDYAASRNRALDLAKEHYNPVFTLMLSADEHVLNPVDMRKFLLEFQFSSGPQHGAYPVSLMCCD